MKYYDAIFQKKSEKDLYKPAWRDFHDTVFSEKNQSIYSILLFL